MKAAESPSKVRGLEPKLRGLTRAHGHIYTYSGNSKSELIKRSDLEIKS